MLARDRRAQRLLDRPIGVADRSEVGLRLDDQIGGTEAIERDRIRAVGELQSELEVS
jgi:hypothetical protein